MAFPNLNGDPEIIKTKTKDDEVKELEHKTEKNDFENFLKPANFDKDYYKKKYESI